MEIFKNVPIFRLEKEGYRCITNSSLIVAECILLTCFGCLLKCHGYIKKNIEICVTIK